MSVIDALRDGWGWTGIDFGEIHAVSPMGHVLFSDKEGCFHHLEPEVMTVTALGGEAAAAAHFADPDVKLAWQALGLVEPARERLGECPEGFVYSLTPMALIEGDFKPENVWIVSLEELIRFSGDMAHQTKDVSDGSQIRIRIVD
jgi:hypothetical protein